MALIEVQNVSKAYRRWRGPGALVARGGLFRWLRQRRDESVLALRDISFSVEPGETLGIIGANGSGKSTLLKILAGVTAPTTGHVIVRGRVASLLELGAGFHPLLTGRENIYLNGRILGFRREQIDRVFEQIVEFSGIREFIDQPVYTYSSGMYIRIGFAVAVHTDPDVFLVDEVLSVGDEAFQRKCRVRIGELREQGKTIVFVSHDLSIVNTLCDRVILLNKGVMVTRDTPQATIDYYLRQIGREKGIHTLADAATEMIFSHGRVSLFHARQEVSAAMGFKMDIQNLGQFHDSTSADWDVTERTPAGCRARGQMSRLPLAHDWRFRLEGNKLVWDLALECERDVSVESLNLNLYLPTRYVQWCYGELSGPFPKILPGDLSWSTVVSPELTCHQAAALPEPATPLPPLIVSMTAHRPYLRMQWMNTDYILGGRVLQAGARIPDSEATLPRGRHDLMTIEVEMAASAEAVRERMKAQEEARALRVGAVTAKFEHGQVRFSHGGEELTACTHLYTSILIGDLWNNSQYFMWGVPKRTGNRVEVSGESRRFPIKQHWALEVVQEGIAFEVWVEASEPIEIQEYHTSIGLVPEYDRWETEHESGEFPPFEPGQESWRHVNRLYAPGRWIRALSSRRPSVSVAVTPPDMRFRMTAINTGYVQNARVLQALQVPEAGALVFGKGRHLYFSGVIAIR